MDNRSGFSRWSLRLVLVGVGLVILAVFGNRLGLDFRIVMFGLIGGLVMCLLAVFSGVIGISITIKNKQPGMTSALFGLIFGLLVTLPFFMAIQAGSNVPPIHDITTDLQKPPEFVAVLALRTANHNPLNRKNPADLNALQQTGYPNLAPAVINGQANQVFDQALALVKARGWDVVAISKKNGHIEATATTLIMGFKDDVVIRVRGEASNTIVDMRSASRVGRSDLGANAARIEAFLEHL